MEKHFDLNELLRRAEELQILKFFEELMGFVKEMQPTLESINSSIMENLHKMPTATKKLSKVTEATELATTEILDLVDGLFIKNSLITDRIKKNQGFINDYRIPFENILLKLNESAPTELNNEIKKQLETFLSDDRILNLTKESTDTSDSINNDLTNIMMSLQVQDITSQQIAAVNHLLNTIQFKLSSILKRFQTTEINQLINERGKFDENKNISLLHRDIAFDPDAVRSSTDKKARQDEVDRIFDKDYNNKENIEILETAENSNSEVCENISDDDINSLFAIETKEVEYDTSFVPAIEEDDGLSQDDIDNLFK